MRARLARLRDHWEAWALAGLLLVHVALGVYWSVVIPIWEAHDEDGHWFFVRLVATEHRLPRPGERSISPNDEMHQPPLYYILAAIPVSFVDLSDNLMPHYNPHMLWPNAQGGQNRVIHDPAVESWPYRGTVLGIHLARWVSVLLGALVVTFAFLAGRELGPEEPWVRWTAALLVAFWPQFRFSTAVMNNDIMVAACAGAATWLGVRLVASGQVRAVDVAGLGAAVGLALLSKNSALGLLPAALLVLAGATVARARELGLKAVGALGGAVVTGALAVGWWYAMNAAVGAGTLGGMRSVASVMELVRTLWANVQGATFAREAAPVAVREGLMTVWAAFGWNNVRYPMGVYLAAAGGAAAALPGLVLMMARARRSPRRVASLASLALVAFSVPAAVLFFYAGRGRSDLQGRYLLGALPGVATLLSAGWKELVPRRARGLACAAVAGALGVLAVITPAAYIAPAYTRGTPLGASTLGALSPAKAIFGQFVELEGYQFGERIVERGAPLNLILRWRTLARAPVDYTLAVQLFGPGRTLLGEVHRFPGRGAFATTTWTPGTVFEESVTIPVASEAAESQMAWVEISYYDAVTKAPTTVRDANGVPLGAALRVEGIKVRGTAQASSPPPAPQLWFGPSIGLAGADARLSPVASGQALEVALRWVALERPAADYTVSVQVRDAQDRIVVQDDAQPRQNGYPTSFWEPGEVIEDRHTLAVPSDVRDGEYGVYLCVYDPRTMERLPVRDAQGGDRASRETKLYSFQVSGGKGRPASGQG